MSEIKVQNWGGIIEGSFLTFMVYKVFKCCIFWGTILYPKDQFCTSLRCVVQNIELYL